MRYTSKWPIITELDKSYSKNKFRDSSPHVYGKISCPERIEDKATSLLMIHLTVKLKLAYTEHSAVSHAGWGAVRLKGVKQEGMG